MKLEDAIIMYEYEIREANSKLEIMRAVQKGEDARFACCIRISGASTGCVVSAQKAQKWDWDWVKYDFKKVVPPQEAYIIRNKISRAAEMMFPTLAAAQQEVHRFRASSPEWEIVKFVEERK